MLKQGWRLHALLSAFYADTPLAEVCCFAENGKKRNTKHATRATSRFFTPFHSYLSLLPPMLLKLRDDTSDTAALQLTLIKWIMASWKNTRSIPAPRMLSLYCSKYIFNLSSRPSNDGTFKRRLAKTYFTLLK